jgi:IS5 family transposase
MTNYARLSEKPLPFLSLTAYTVVEFQALLPTFSTAFLRHMQKNTLDAKKREKRRFVAYRNSPLPTMEDKLLFILMYLRKATTQDIFGEVFQMPQPVANKWIHILHPCLHQALAELKELPARTATDLQLPQEAGQVYFQDGTERAIERPKEAEAQTTFYSGKRKRHTVKNNVLVNASSKIILLTPTCEGKKHDKKIADETHLTLPKGSDLYQDTGFQGYSLADVTILQPLKKPRGRELTSVEKENNRGISHIRIRVEHAIGGVKRYRIVKDQLRTRKDDFRDRAMETCCGLHNFRLNFRPWNYASNSIKS